MPLRVPCCPPRGGRGEVLPFSSRRALLALGNPSFPLQVMGCLANTICFYTYDNQHHLLFVWLAKYSPDKREGQIKEKEQKSDTGALRAQKEIHPSIKAASAPSSSGFLLVSSSVSSDGRGRLAWGERGWTLIWFTSCVTRQFLNSLGPHFFPCV